MKITADITQMNILNINMQNGDDLIMLSIPMSDNVVDMNEEVLFTHYIGGIVVNSGTKKTLEVFNLFKTDNNG